MLGRQIGPYEIVEKLGEGGMGVVYRGRDTRLNRPVALKCLTADAPSDPDRRRRFLQEAQAASSLNHPGIVTVYDIASADGQDVIAMEYVPGVSLDRLLAPDGRQRPLRLPDALDYAIQVADALAAAHAAGIVHRDLKPGNIMVSESGATKIVDFGLAKLALPASSTETVDVRNDAVTIATSAPLTERGVILGTVTYMSPEQAEGRPVDRRSDIFSFGTIVYEMLTGGRPFSGATPMSTLASIISTEAPTLAARLPEHPDLCEVVDRCLRKNPARRWQHIDDVKVALLEVKARIDAGRSAVPATAPAARTTLGASVLTAVIAGLTIGGLAVWATRPSTPAPTRPPSLMQVTADEGLTGEPALSPDGKLVAYASDRRDTSDAASPDTNTDLWVQQVAGGQAIRLTRDPADDYEPSFAPDGSKIVFRSDRDGGGLYVVSALGGQAQRLVSGGHYARYSPDGKWIAYWDGEPASGILFVSGDARIWLVPAEGGNPVAVHHDFAVAYPPMWSADSKRVVFWGRRQPDQEYDVWAVSVGSNGDAAPTGAAEVLRRQGIDAPRLVSSLARDNAWLFASGRNLWRLPIDAGSWRAREVAEIVTFGAAIDSTPSSADDGSVAFESGRSAVGVWRLPIDANRVNVIGSAQRITGGTSRHGRPFVTKNGAYVVYSSDRSGNDDVWIKDMKTGVERPVIATSAREIAGALSPDATMVAYSSDRPDAGERLRVSAIAGGASQEICSDCNSWFEWTAKGDALLGLARRNGRFGAVLVTPQGQERWYLAHSQHNIFSPRLSPDGRWLALSVNQGQGRAATWIAPMEGERPAAEHTWILITEESGGYADKQDWSADGNVLYYYSNRDGFGCIYAQRLDPSTKRPSGPPIGVSHWHSSSRSMRTVGLGMLNLSVGTDAVVFNLAERTGNIWMLRPPTP